MVGRGEGERKRDRAGGGGPTRDERVERETKRRGGGMDAGGLRVESAKERGRHRGERRRPAQLRSGVGVSVHADTESVSALA